MIKEEKINNISSSIVDILAKNDSIFLPDEEQGFFNKRDQDVICDATKNLYCIVVQCQVDYLILPKQIQSKYQKLLDENFENYDSPQLEELRERIDDAFIQLSHLHQNIEIAFLSNICFGTDAELSAKLKQYWNNDLISLRLRENAEKAQKIIELIRQKLQEKQTKLQDKTNQNYTDRFERLYSSAHDILEQIEEQEKDNADALKKAQKLLEEVQELTNGVRKEAEDNAQKNEEQLKRIEDKSNDILPNILTILGIFVAIIIAVIGGYFNVMQIDGKSISSIAQVRMMYSLLMGQILINLIFLLMFMISKLSNRTVSVFCIHQGKNEHPGNCQSCENAFSCSFLQRIWRKYPYWLVANQIIVVGYAVLVFWWYIDTYLFYGIDCILKANPGYAWILFLGLLLLLIVFLACVYKKVKTKRKNETNSTKNSGSNSTGDSLKD